MARDQFDREIDYLRISVTDRCNLGCRYCMPVQRGKTFDPAEIMTDDEIVRIVRVAMEHGGVRKVRLTGGEPLVRPGIVGLVSRLGALGLADLSLTTNGTSLGRMARELRDAGLTRLNVSLDSLRADRFAEITGGGSLEAVQAGIGAAEEAGLDPVKINMVPLRGINDDEIVDFARMTIAKPLHIRFIEFMPSHGSGHGWDEHSCVRSEEVRRIIEAELGPMDERRFKGRGPSRNFVVPGASGIVGFISAVSHSFCYSCNRLRINAVGRIRTCLFSHTSIDVLGPMRAGAGDHEVARLFALALASKPEGNYLRKPGAHSIESMPSIGG